MENLNINEQLQGLFKPLTVSLKQGHSAFIKHTEAGILESVEILFNQSTVKQKLYLVSNDTINLVFDFCKGLISKYGFEKEIKGVWWTVQKDLYKHRELLYPQLKDTVLTAEEIVILLDCLESNINYKQGYLDYKKERNSLLLNDEEALLMLIRDIDFMRDLKNQYVKKHTEIVKKGDKWHQTLVKHNKEIVVKNFIKEVNTLRLANKHTWYSWQGVVNNKQVVIKGYGTWLQVFKVDGINCANCADCKVSEFKFHLENGVV